MQKLRYRSIGIAAIRRSRSLGGLTAREQGVVANDLKKRVSGCWNHFEAEGVLDAALRLAKTCSHCRMGRDNEELKSYADCASMVVLEKMFD